MIQPAGAPVLGAIGGGVAVPLATKAIPRMMAQTGGEGSTPSEM